MDKSLNDNLSKLSGNMKIMVATLEVLDQCIKGQLSYETATKRLDVIEQEFHALVKD